MLCNEKVLDLFVTRDAYDLDETWVASMVSVLMNDVTSSTSTALITTKLSDWVIPWCSHSTTCKVGDLVRIGTPSRGGKYATDVYDYMVIMEVRDVEYVGNETTEDITAPFQVPTVITAGGGISTNVIEKVQAYRLNHAVNVTTPPNGTITNRHTLIFNETWANTFQDHKAQRKMAAPMFKCNEQVGSLQCRLDGGVKGIHFITLMGYTLSTKRRVGFQNEHEMIADDWLALSIDEVQGSVHSNNPHASGAFAILHAGSSHDNQYGTVEYHRWEPGGLHTHTFSSPTTSMSTLNLKVKDRRGRPAHFGRLHLWFRLGVSHG